MNELIVSAHIQPTRDAHSNWNHVLAVLAKHRYVTGPLLSAESGQSKNWCYAYLACWRGKGKLKRVTAGRYRLADPTTEVRPKGAAAQQTGPMGKCRAMRSGPRPCWNLAMREGGGFCWMHRDQRAEEAAE